MYFYFFCKSIIVWRKILYLITCRFNNIHVFEYLKLLWLVVWLGVYLNLLCRKLGIKINNKYMHAIRHPRNWLEWLHKSLKKSVKFGEKESRIQKKRMRVIMTMREEGLNTVTSLSMMRDAGRNSTQAVTSVQH